MALPKKKSHVITIDGINFRWLVTFRNGHLHLTVESENKSGQLLQAAFEPHDGYSKVHSEWERRSQRRQITPSTVRRIVQHSIANGWTPREKRSTTFRISAWNADQIVPCSAELPVDQIPLRDIAIEQVCDLQYDLSLDPAWRKTLFGAEVGKPHSIPSDYFGLSDDSKRHSLRFQAFNDGGIGMIVFGIQSIEFPDVIAYTTNNPEIVDW